MKPGNLTGRGSVPGPHDRIPVTVVLNGLSFDGWAEGWNGDQVCVRYRKPDGFLYITWVPSTDVQRREGEPMTGKVYDVDVQEDDGRWTADVTSGGARVVSTWAPERDMLDTSVREAIVVAEDLPDDAQAALTLAWRWPVG